MHEVPAEGRDGETGAVRAVPRPLPRLGRDLLDARASRTQAAASSSATRAGSCSPYRPSIAAASWSQSSNRGSSVVSIRRRRVSNRRTRRAGGRRTPAATTPPGRTSPRRVPRPEDGAEDRADAGAGPRPPRPARSPGRRTHTPHRALAAPTSSPSCRAERSCPNGRTAHLVRRAKRNAAAGRQPARTAAHQASASHGAEPRLPSCVVSRTVAPPVTSSVTASRRTSRLRPRAHPRRGRDAHAVRDRPPSPGSVRCRAMNTSSTYRPSSRNSLSSTPSTAKPQRS